MLWIYARGQESLRVETRFDNDTEEFVLISYGQDGVPVTERFKDPASFKRRLTALEQQLAVDGWDFTGAPVLLRDGWKI